MLPCEKAHWKILPAIRKEFARVFVMELKLSQSAAAKILELTESAVSQYIKEKRGTEAKLSRETIQLIKKLAYSKERNPEKLLCSACRFELKKRELKSCG